MPLTRPLYSIYSIFLVVGLTTFKDMSSHQAYSPECVEGRFSEVRPSPMERSSSQLISKIIHRVQDILQILKEVDNMNGGKGIYLGGTLVSILISLALYATGRRESAIFVGLWAPTILNLGQSILEED
jgi:hypothetical protein